MRKARTLVRLAPAVVAALVMLLTAQGVFAHASLVKADPSPGSTLPQSPPRVILWFAEPIEPRFSEIRVLDSSGSRVDNGDTAVDRGNPKAMSVTLKPLGPGVYTVAWRNISALDGHPLRDTFTFAVGQVPAAGQPASARPPLFQSPGEPFLRWLSLLGALALVGGFGFYLLVWSPAVGSLKEGGRLPGSQGWAVNSRGSINGRGSINRTPMGRRKESGPSLAGRLQAVQWGAAIVLTAAEIGRLVVQASIVYDIPIHQALGFSAIGAIENTEWGHLWLWRILLLGAVVAVMSRLGNTFSGAARGNAGRWLALLLGAGMLATFSLASHGSALADLRMAGTVSDFLHLLAAAFWVGGLVHFLLGMPLFQALRPKDRLGLLQALVPRFSMVAGLSVAVLIVTGLYSAWAMAGTIAAAYLQTPYGLSLVAKIAVVGPLLVVAALNLLWVRPRLSQERAEEWLRKLVRVEVVLAVLALLAVGFLTTLETARPVAARLGLGQEQVQLFHAVAGDKHVSVRIEPGDVGPNAFVVSVDDARGSPVNNADVSLRLAYRGADVGATDFTAAPSGDGEYSVGDVSLGIAGLWRLELTIRSRGSFDATTAIPFKVEAAGTVDSGAVSPGTGNLLFGVELLLLGLLFLGTGLVLGGWRNRAGAALMSSGTLAAIFGIILMGSTIFVATGGGQASTNPFPPTSVRRLPASDSTPNTAWSDTAPGDRVTARWPRA